MNTDDDSPRAPELERMRQEAATWLALRDAGFSAPEQDEFFAWLAKDPRHAEVFSELQKVFKDMDAMVEWRPLNAPEPNPDLLLSPLGRPRGARRWGWILAMAAALALGLWVWQGSGDPRSTSAAIRLPLNEAAPSYERHVLEDGSVVELNRGAQVTLQFEASRRLIQLVSGDAYFSVAKDPNRPFVVRAGGGEVTAIGTEFNVSLASGHVEVFVTEGRIRFEPLKGERLRPGADDADSVQMLEAGQGVLVPVNGPSGPLVVSTYPAQVVAEKLSWKDELVEFTNTPLSEVILEFNRRNHTQLVIGDHELAARPISGTLRPNNLEGFVELLRVTQEIHAERFGSSKIVLRKLP